VFVSRAFRLAAVFASTIISWCNENVHTQVYDNTTALPVNTPKSYGKSIKAADLPIGIAKFFPLPSTGSGLPRTTLLPILESVRADVGTLRDSIAQIEMRMVGGSVLIIYEGDWDRAHAGLSVLARKRRATLAQEEEEEPEQEEEEESDSDESNPEPQPVGSPCVVRLIDFAHTRLTPGEGYDEGVLRGLDTVLRLLDGRIFEVKLAEE
jgi:1D-myo-inositol-tetrakisphosphate 5-kinase/inositol-polyphosphate multikinase